MGVTFLVLTNVIHLGELVPAKIFFDNLEESEEHSEESSQMDCDNSQTETGIAKAEIASDEDNDEVAHTFDSPTEGDKIDMDYTYDSHKYIDENIIGVNCHDVVYSQKHGWYSFQSKIDYGRYSYKGMVSFYAFLARVTSYPFVDSDGESDNYDVEAIETVRSRSHSGPFYELITFSPGEGTIGTKVCRKLAKDFKRMRDGILSAKHSFHDHYITMGRMFRKAAKCNGFVVYN